MLGGDSGSLLQTIILSSSILYELIGPACAKLALYLSKSYGNPEQSAVTEAPPPSDVESLEARLLAIQREIETKKYVRTEEEDAFMQAAEENDEISDYMKRKFKNRR
jgi:hypothetical protein